MTDNPLEEAARRVLNDRRVFRMTCEVIGQDDWAKLKRSMINKQEAERIISQAQDALRAKQRQETDSRRRQELEEAAGLLEGLKKKIDQGSALAASALDRLNSLGLIKCCLPSMDDFGTVIEGHGRETAERFFLYKIDKEKDNRRRQALTALLDVVKGLYNQHVEPLEIAFFVRKIESLTQIVEVLK